MERKNKKKVHLNDHKIIKHWKLKSGERNS